jgi:transposase-like protein
MICTIGGERVCFWRAVDDEGETPDLVVRKRLNSGAALKLLKRLLRTQGVDRVGLATTSAPKTRICRSEDASGRCWGSGPCPLRTAASPRTLRSATLSIFRGR